MTREGTGESCCRIDEKEIYALLELRRKFIRTISEYFNQLSKSCMKRHLNI